MDSLTSLKQQIEAVLFISPRPLTVVKLANLLESKKEDVEASIETLEQELKTRAGAIRMLRHGTEIQLVTAPEVAELVEKFLKEETSGELTKPSLETLTIIAYRGPITKSDLEKIRGVNCSLILRNLMIRGLVEADEDKKRLLTFYTVSSDFVRHLGLTDIRDLPDFETLHNPEVVERLLAESPRE